MGLFNNEIKDPVLKSMDIGIKEAQKLLGDSLKQYHKEIADDVKHGVSHPYERRQKEQNERETLIRLKLRHRLQEDIKRL